MANSPDPDELADRISSLEESLTRLQHELQTDQQGGPPRLPRPGDILRATDDHAIPAIIALLEAHIHALRLLQRTIRLVAPPPRSRDGSPGSTAFRRATDSLTAQIEQLLGDLDEIPTNREPNALDPLIEEAKAIRAELSAMSDPTNIPIEDPNDFDEQDDTDASEDNTGIDIDAELDSIRSELTDDKSTPEDDEDDTDSPDEC